MQSGRGNTKEWVLEFAPESARKADPLMGWTGSGDMRGQVRLTFPSKEEAVSYCRKNKIPFQVKEPHERKMHKKTYADNFAFDRKGTWTH